MGGYPPAGRAGNYQDITQHIWCQKTGKFAFDKLGIFVSKHQIMHFYVPAMGDQHGNKGQVFKIVADL